MIGGSGLVQARYMGGKHGRQGSIKVEIIREGTSETGFQSRRKARSIESGETSRGKGREAGSSKSGETGSGKGRQTGEGCIQAMA
ncbi:MAG: hypothetical protein WBO55_16200 [Rhizobiaceae bacterium]